MLEHGAPARCAHPRERAHSAPGSRLCHHRSSATGIHRCPCTRSPQYGSVLQLLSPSPPTRGLRQQKLLFLTVLETSRNPGVVSAGSAGGAGEDQFQASPRSKGPSDLPRSSTSGRTPPASTLVSFLECLCLSNLCLLSRVRTPLTDMSLDDVTARPLM